MYGPTWTFSPTSPPKVPYASTSVTPGYGAPLTISGWVTPLMTGDWAIWSKASRQFVRSVLPALLNNFIGLLLYTSIASTIGVHELTYAGGKLNTATFQSVVVFTGVAALYLVLSVAASAGVRRLERVQARRD